MFLMFFFGSDCNPKGIDGVKAGYDYELARES